MDADVDVDLGLVAGGDQRLARDRLVERAREVLLEAAAVDLDLAAAWDDNDTGNRCLALAGRLDAGVRGKIELGGLAHGLLRAVLGGLGLKAGALLLLGLEPGALLGAELALLLQPDRLQVGARGDLGRLALGCGLGRLLGGRDGLVTGRLALLGGRGLIRRRSLLRRGVLARSGRGRLLGGSLLRGRLLGGRCDSSAGACSSSGAASCSAFSSCVSSCIKSRSPTASAAVPGGGGRGRRTP